MDVLRQISIFLLLTSLLVSQESAPSGSSELPKIKTSTELVLVPVIVHKSGAHLSGLKKEDFRLMQDDKQQDIAIFEEVHAEQPTARPPSANQEFTNVKFGANTVRLTIVALDLVNTSPLDQVYLKQEIIKFMETAAQSGDRFSLIAMTTKGVHILQDFTADPAMIVAALNKEHGRTTSQEAPGGTGNPILDQTPCAASGNGCGSHEGSAEGAKELKIWLPFYQTEESFEIFRDRNSRYDTLNSLQQLAQWLSGVPGRKTLVWAGSGVQLYGGLMRVAAGSSSQTHNYANVDFRSVSQAMDENTYTFNQLSAANVAVYPLDARHGANTSFGAFDISHTDAPIGQGAFSGQKGRIANQDQEVIAMFEQVAERTGGKSCFNRTDLSNCLKEFAADSRDYYMLGFYVDKSAKPGWHPLSIKLDQKAEMRYRRGFAIAVPGQAAPQHVDDFQMALSSPLPYTGMEIEGRFLEIVPKGDKRLVRFELNLPPQAIAIGEQDNSLKLDIRAVVRGTDGKVAGNVSQRIDRKLEAQQASVIRSEGIHYTNRVELPPGNYGVWFAVHDANTDRTGSVVTQLKVQ